MEVKEREIERIKRTSEAIGAHVQTAVLHLQFRRFSVVLCVRVVLRWALVAAESVVSCVHFGLLVGCFVAVERFCV